ncbi:hypothetical protein F4561_002648 [Lipingzhangella halophila]|uniref:Phage Mu protein F like protein n=1 Tax=Lipingzhangella halophila TaxID=1783352 RepID=A0A7W7W2V5_9ACTN|nr:hypothetical protein [Lipingzhangella halophila]MBB4931828.1 hypothetical protein [Lipingzhangella halophila]
MTTPLAPAPPATNGPTPAQRLDAAEQQAQDRIDEALAGVAAAGITGVALLGLSGAITAAVLAPVQTALGIGASIALSGSNRRRPRDRQLTEQRLPSPVDTDVEMVLLDAAGRVDAAEDKAAELERVRRRLYRLAVTKIHQAASAGTLMYARWLGLGLQWVTRQDGHACIVCATMHGRRVRPGQAFAPPRGPGIPKLWAGFQGLPPAHPNCRCRPRVVRT